MSSKLKGLLKIIPGIILIGPKESPILKVKHI